METFIEPIRITVSGFALLTVAAVVGALRPSDAGPWRGVVLGWGASAAIAGLFFTHVARAVPAPALVPAVAGIGLALAVASGFSERVRRLFDALDDRQWRSLMLLRAVFGALLLASGGTGLMPVAFALPAGLGDLFVGGLALAAPGSLAAGGNRGARLLVFGVGIVDFINVIALQATVLVPWLAQSHSVGTSLLLPWLAVPVLAALNMHGLRRVLGELFATAPAVARG